MPKRNPSIPRAVPGGRLWPDPEDAGHPFVLNVLPDGRNVETFDDIYLASAIFQLEPKILTDYIEIPPLTDSEMAQVENAIDTSLDSRDKEMLEHSIFLFLAGVALADNVPRWTELRDRLKRTLHTVETLLSLIEVEEHTARRRGFVPTDEAIHLFVRQLGLETSVLRRVADACRDRLSEIAPLASKRGEPGDVSFRVLLQCIVSLARSKNIDLELSGHEDIAVGDYEPKRLMRMTRVILKIARDKAVPSYSNPRLSADERDRALHTVQRLTRKDHRALVDQLEIARAFVKARRTA